MTIYREDVPAFLKERLPSYSEMIDEHVRDLGPAANYPLFGNLLPEIVTNYRRDPSDAAELRAFLRAAEDMFVRGEDAVRDLIGLEVVEPIAQPDMRELELHKMMGPALRSEYSKYVESLRHGGQS